MTITYLFSVISLTNYSNQKQYQDVAAIAGTRRGNKFKIGDIYGLVSLNQHVGDAAKRLRTRSVCSSRTRTDLRLGFVGTGS